MYNNIADNSIETCITKSASAVKDIWADVFHVLKPGGTLITINTTEFHRTACHIEDAGFEIRDTIHIIKCQNSNLATLAMKPLDGTFITNAQRWHVSGLNIDSCRIAHTTVNGGNLADNPHLRKNI